MTYRPEGVTTVTAYLTVRRGSDAIEFYKRAFDAQERYRLDGEGGRVEHATLAIGDSIVYLSDEGGEMKSPASLGGSPVTLHLYVPDCDATWQRALAAGAKVRVPLALQEWGDRYGQIEDPFGHLWGISTQQSAAS